MTAEITVNKGKFRGELLDVRSRRSLAIVYENEERFVADHFFHNGEFYRAVIPKKCVKSIYGQKFNFSVVEGKKGFQLKNPFVNHAQVRFHLHKDFPLKLYANGVDFNPDDKPLFELSDFVYSVEVVGPKGVAWGLSDAFGDFIATHRFVSLDEVVFERLVMKSYRVTQSPPLLLTQDEMNQALELVVKRSDQAGMHERYYLFTIFFKARNCTSEPFLILDKITKHRYTIFQRIVAKLFWRLPIYLRGYLKLRGLIDPKQVPPILNDECRDLALSKPMQDRLKALKALKE